MNELNDQNKNEKIAALEALLFVYGEPLQIEEVAKILSLTKEEAIQLIKEYDLLLQESSRGLNIISYDDKIQLTTKANYSYLIENLIKKELNQNLTPASLEALALILYFGPISRAQIEYFRGVDSSFILRNLMFRGLIERCEDETFHRAYLYQPSFKLLRHLGIKKIQELPDYEKFQKLNQQLEAQQAESLLNKNFGDSSGLVSN